jgi:hypothetical protein
MVVIEVNFLAVLVSAVASFAIGSLWYSPILFGKMWMQHMGINSNDTAKMESMKKGRTKAMVGSFVGAFVMAYVLAYFIGFMNAATVAEGIQLGFWIWLGFVATILLNSVFYESRPWGLYLINASHYLVVLLVMGVILALWK